MDMMRVEINTETELYPELSISDSPDRGRTEIPRELYQALQAAYEQVAEAELAIMRYAAEHYPEATAFRDWLNDYDT